MNYENFKTGYNKPTTISATQYDTKVTIEIDHSDTDVDELFDAFQTILLGLGYHESAFKNWVVERAEEYKDDEDDNVVVATAYTYEEFKRDEESYRYRATEEDESEFDDYGKRVSKPKKSKKK